MAEHDDKYMILFFAGAEARNNRFNGFTGSFINLMREIMGEKFDLITGIYFDTNIRNVVWALSNAQRPGHLYNNTRLQNISIDQIINKNLDPDTQLIIVSSSSGSVVAAQTASYLAEKNTRLNLLQKPFHLALGSSMVSKDSELFESLKKYQLNGQIGKIIYDELQDKGDNTTGIGGKTKTEAFINSIGIIIPLLSIKYSGPSFLNTHPENGHIHRRRSQQVQKAIDYIDVILIRNMLAGTKYHQKAKEVIRSASEKLPNK